MKKVINPTRTSWNQLCLRPSLNEGTLDTTVRDILDRTRKGGDAALRDITEEIEGIFLESLSVSSEEIVNAKDQLAPALIRAIEIASQNIKKFHEAQKRETMSVETMNGVLCWRKATPIQKVGIYIPGGSAPLFSTVLMLAIPAQLAGCSEIILCTPPGKDGKINPAILYAATITNVKKIFRIGGAQAIAAMAYGTESISKVSKIFGPGNQYVTKAKQLVSLKEVAIDMPAGPSEVLVIADLSSNPSFVAADLLSQAEHGPDSQVVLVSCTEEILSKVENEINNQLDKLPRKALAQKSLEKSLSILFQNKNDLIDFVNEYAPEHLIINTSDADEIANDICNAGSVFIGPYTPESAGDYASGTNHTLPTSGFAKMYGGVSLESFTKFITFQKISAAGLKEIGPAIESMAEAEQLIGHGNAVRIRLENLK